MTRHTMQVTFEWLQGSARPVPGVDPVRDATFSSFCKQSMPCSAPGLHRSLQCSDLQLGQASWVQSKGLHANMPDSKVFSHGNLGMADLLLTTLMAAPG